MRKLILYISAFAAVAAGVQCKKDEVMAYTVPAVKQGLKSENVIVLVIDGPRMSETWGDPQRKLIPNIANYFAENGVIYDHFRNSGGTYTLSGHTAITTGHYQDINNSGEENPEHHSLFQAFLKETGKPSDKAWIISSKEKLHVLANTKNKNWKNKYCPSYNCGENGENRDDNATLNKAKEILDQHHPNLTLIQFKEPDYSGHANDWDGYLRGIRNTDSLAMELWKFIESDPVYSGKTSLLITNDHGRHSKGWLDGFVSHGDNCDGCRNIMLVGIGPDFKKKAIVSTEGNQTDITTTVASMLQMKTFSAEGKVLEDLFAQPQ